MKNEPHRTAITRKTLSAPMRWLNERGLIPMGGDKHKRLDYGCGKGFDADQLGMMKFDPHFFPETCTGFNWYDIITCNYVLNVLPTVNERLDVLSSIVWGLNGNGVAYVSVRNDKRSLNGWTAKGTWQGFVEDDELETQGFRRIHEEANFRMFKYDKRNKAK